MKDINVTEAKNRLTELVKEVEATTTSYYILRSGHRAAILLSAEEYDSLLETLEVLRDQSLMRQIARSARDFSRGRGIAFSKIRRNA